MRCPTVETAISSIRTGRFLFLAAVVRAGYGETLEAGRSAVVQVTLPNWFEDICCQALYTYLSGASYHGSLVTNPSFV